MSDFGFSADDEVEEITIRGSINLGNSGLDAAIVGNLSLGPNPNPVTVPDVIGQTRAAAEMAIATAGLTVGTVSEAPSDTVPAGDVVSQMPSAGVGVAPGTAVHLVVSTGPGLSVDNHGVLINILQIILSDD